jgi:hypothetical protein
VLRRLFPLEPTAPFFEDVVRVIRLSNSSTNQSIEALASSIGRQSPKPPWRTQALDPFMVVTDDEILAQFQRIEYYVRFAAMLQMNLEPRLDPIVIGQFSRSLARPIAVFKTVKQDLEKAVGPPDVGDDRLSSIDWLWERVAEAVKAHMMRPKV